MQSGDGREGAVTSNHVRPEQKETDGNPSADSKPKVLVIMGASGSGKSRLAIDLASHFPIEIVNADAMQVYQGLDVLTNKVPSHEQKGVPHHLLGTVSPTIEFTVKDFRQAAVSLINDIWSRNCLPVIVGGTNYYIQALVSPFLMDYSLEDMDEDHLSNPSGDKEPNSVLERGEEKFSCHYDRLKDLDPIAANRIHPNDNRKINQYLTLYARSGVVPSKLLQGKIMKNWGQVDNSQYNWCFICIDASTPALDQYVGRRVDLMVEAGLLNEVYDIYSLDADYTRGLQQAVGVREFKDFLSCYVTEGKNGTSDPHSRTSTNKDDCKLEDNLRKILNTSEENQQKFLLKEAIEKVKLNTRRLVRRQKRRLNQLHTLFGWNMHFVDASESLICFTDDLWAAHVVEPSVKIIKSFLDDKKASAMADSEAINGTNGLKLTQRDLWTQYVCQACGHKVLRGAHEWEQHKQGRSHRKRTYRLRKSERLGFVE